MPLHRFRLGAKLLQSKITGERVPFQVNIHINDVCNLRCRYCYIDFDHAAKDFPLPELKKVLKEAREMGAERISLEGGEPLLRKDIGEVIDFIYELGMESNINTNGYLLPNRIGGLKHLDIVSVSLDGDEEVHDSLRGAGSFEKAMNAIKIAKAHGIKVHVLSVLTKMNHDKIDFMIRLAKEVGFQFVPNTVFYFPDEKGRDKAREPEYVIPEKEYRALMRNLYERKLAGDPIVWSAETLKYVSSWPVQYDRSNLWADEVPANWKPVKCLAGIYYCVIQTNGDLYTCDPMIGYGKTANVFQIGFKEAFKQLSIGKCVACTSLVLTEYHQLFGLKPQVVTNMVQSYGKTG